MIFFRSNLFLVPCILLVFSGWQANSQTLPEGYHFNMHLHYGFVMNHSVNMGHLANQRPFGFQLELQRETDGKKVLQQLYKYPITGYTFHFFRMDPEKPLGNTYSMIIYFDKHLLQTCRSRLSYRVGTGPVLINKRFDLQNNYKNNLISSRINYSMYGNITYRFSLGSTSLSAGISLLHYSNGAMKVPNLGINIPTIHLGVGLNGPSPVKLFQDSLPSMNKDIVFNFTGTAAIKEVHPPGGRVYPVLGLSVYGNKPVNRKSSLNLGFDFFYDGSAQHHIQRYAELHEDKSKNYLQFALTGGHELLLSRVALLTQLGFYLHDPLARNKIVYQRYGIKYYFKQNLYAATSLKTHFGNADFIEWSLGYTLR